MLNDRTHVDALRKFMYQVPEVHTATIVGDTIEAFTTDITLISRFDGQRWNGLEIEITVTEEEFHMEKYGVSQEQTEELVKLGICETEDEAREKVAAGEADKLKKEAECTNSSPDQED